MSKRKYLLLKGLNIFVDCVEKKEDRNLISAISCYTGGPRNYGNPISSSDCQTLNKDEIWWKD